MKIIALKHFYRFSRSWMYYSAGLCVLLGFYGLLMGFWGVPADYQQGEAFRIIYLHVPAAFLSLGIYVFIGIQSILFLIWRIKLCDLLAANSVGIGASFTLIALITGALWGKPMWGTAWVWDARLCSVLILFFLYLGLSGIRSAIPSAVRAAQACAILSVIGLADIPIIHFSVQWWATLHQGPTLSQFSKPSIDPIMLYPLIAMIFAFLFFYISLLIFKTRIHIVERETDTQWLQTLLQSKVHPDPKGMLQ